MTLWKQPLLETKRWCDRCIILDKRSLGAHRLHSNDRNHLLAQVELQLCDRGSSVLISQKVETPFSSCCLYTMIKYSSQCKLFIVRTVRGFLIFNLSSNDAGLYAEASIIDDCCENEKVWRVYTAALLIYSWNGWELVRPLLIHLCVSRPTYTPQQSRRSFWLLPQILCPFRHHPT